MAARRTKKKGSEVQMPSRFTRVKEVRPEGALDLDVGESAEGILVGAARPSKLNPTRRYRVLKMADGAVYVNGTAKLEQLGLMDFPPNTEVFIVRLEDVQTGQAQPMKDYAVGVVGAVPGQDGDEGDLPF